MARWPRLLSSPVGKRRFGPGNAGMPLVSREGPDGPEDGQMACRAWMALYYYYSSYYIHFASRASPSRAAHPADGFSFWEGCGVPGTRSTLWTPEIFFLPVFLGLEGGPEGFLFEFLVLLVQYKPNFFSL